MATFNLSANRADTLNLEGIGLGEYTVGDLTKPRQLKLAEYQERAEALQAEGENADVDAIVGVIAEQVELMLEDAEGVAASIVTAWDEGRVGLNSLTGAVEFLMGLANEETRRGNE